MYGSDFNYAESRLSGSIVRVAKTNEPVYVEAVSIASGLANIKFLSDSHQDTMHIDGLNLKPVPLGWCNQAAGATYLSRIPKRQDWKQGIRAQTCFSSTTRFNNIRHRDLANCIMGKYPTLASLQHKPWAKLVAWSRKWASDGEFLYHGVVGQVGTMDENGFPVLGEAFSYLKESLEKSCS